MLGAILALASALLLGTSDYFAAGATKRLGLIRASTRIYLVATLASAAGLLAFDATWSWQTTAWSAGASAASIVGVLALYSAMAIGPISIVTPLIALVGAAVPVVAGVVLGSRFTWPGWLALGLAFAAAGLMSTAPNAGGSQNAPSPGGGRLQPRTLGLSLLAGLGIGTSVVLLDRVPRGAGTIPVLILNAGGLAVLGVMFAAARRRQARALVHVQVVSGAGGPRTLVAPLVAGICVASGNICLLRGLAVGDLTVVGVLNSLYPLATIAMARLIDGERPSKTQVVGIGAALAASALFALT